MPGQLGHELAPFELMKDDRQSLLAWLGKKDSAEITDADYARFAGAVRQYLGEDSLPSGRLRASVKGLAIAPDQMDRSAGLSDALRGVIGRMLATPREILEQAGHPFDPGKIGGLPYQLIVKPLPVSGAGVGKNIFGLYVVNPTLGFSLNKRLHGVTGEGPHGTRLNEYGQKLYRELEEKQRRGEVLTGNEKEDWEELRDFEVASRYRGRAAPLRGDLGKSPLLEPRPEEGTQIGSFTVADRDAKNVDVTGIDIMHPTAIQLLASAQQPQLMRSIAKALSRHFSDADTIAGFPVKPELKEPGKDWYARFADSIKAKEMAAPELPTRLVLNPKPLMSSDKLAVFDIVVPHDLIKTETLSTELKRADYKEYYGEIGIDKSDPKHPKIADLKLEPDASRFLSAMMLPSFNKALMRELRGHFPDAESIAGVERKTVDLAAQRKLLATPPSAAEELGLALGRKVGAQLPEEIAGRMGLLPKQSDALAPMLRGLKQLNAEMQRPPPAPPFYSAVAKAIENVSQAKASPDQWLGMLKNARGVKAEELQWLGVEDWLKEQKGAITKQALQDYVRANGIEVKEVKKGDLSPRDEDRFREQVHEEVSRREEEWAREVMREEGHRFTVETEQADHDETRWHYTVAGERSRNTFESRSRAQREGEYEAEEREQKELYRLLEDAWQHHGEAGIDYAAIEHEVRENMPRTASTVRHADPNWQLSGGENYRELLLTLPTPNDQYIKFTDAMRAKYGDKPLGEMPMTQQEQAYIDKQINAYGDTGGTFKSSHWDEPNVLAHVRFNDRTIDGKKTLFIEEVQSDWHQKGKKSGYQQPPREEPTGRWRVAQKNPDGSIVPYEFDTKAEAEAWAPRVREAGREATVEPATRTITSPHSAVPDAPFKTTWPELAMKRMLRYAAENGYDKVAWTPGEVQAERYDLSKHINDLRVVRSTGGGNQYTLDATLKGRNERTRIADSIPEDKLADHVGKEMADKIRQDIDAAQNNRWGVKNRVSGNWSPRFATKEEALAYQKSLPESLRGQTDVLEMTPKYSAEYRGLDLKVGGEGMRGFYDEILPAAVNKIVKKFGAKVQQLNIRRTPSGTRQTLDGVHYVDITRPLRGTALEQGFPLFAHAPNTVSRLWATSAEEAHALRVPMRRLPFPEKFPRVVIQQAHDSSVRVQSHPEYKAAKHGNFHSALELVRDVLDPRGIDRLKSLIGKSEPTLVPVHGIELTGHNAIPVAYAKVLGKRLNLPVDREIVAANRPGRTGASAADRMLNRAQFDGPVEPGRSYLIVDDNATMGGTIAELRSHIEQGGGKVIGATVLTGAENSHILAPQKKTLAGLREKLPRLEPWWEQNHGYGFDALTEGEAKYLARFNSTEQVRDRLAPRALWGDAHGNGQAAGGDAQGGAHDAFLTGLGKLALDLGHDELGRSAPSLKGLEQLEFFRRSREAPPHEQGAFTLGRTEHEFAAPPGLSGKISAYTIDDAAGNRIGSVAASLEQGRHLIIHNVSFNPAATVDRGLDTLRGILTELKREYPSARTANLDIGDGRTPGPYIGVPLANLHPFVFEDIRPELKRELDWWWSNQVNPPSRETKLPRNVTAPRAYKERDLAPTEGSFQEFKREWQKMPSQKVDLIGLQETPFGIKTYTQASAKSLYSATIKDVLPKLPKLVIKGVGTEMDKFFRAEVVKRAGDVPIHVLKDADFYTKFNNESGVKGYYSPVSHHIVLPERSLNMPGMLVRWLGMHESGHAATSRALWSDPVARGHLQAIINELQARYGDRTLAELGERSPMTSAADSALERYPGQAEAIRNKKTFGEEYAFTNPFELVTEAWNNPDIERILGRLQPSKALADRLDIAGWKKATMWNALVNVVRKLLGLKPNMHSYLEAIMLVTEPLMKRDVSAWTVRDAKLQELRELTGLKEVPRGEERTPPAPKPWLKGMEPPPAAEPAGRSQAHPAWYDYVLGGLTLGERTILRRLFGMRPPYPNWIIRPDDPIWGWLAPPRKAVTMKQALDRLTALSEADRAAVLGNGERVFTEQAEKEATQKGAGAEKPATGPVTPAEGKNAPAAAVAARIPKMDELDAEIAQYQRQLEGVELSPEDVAELEAAHLDLDQANNMLEAYAQAANCLAQGGM